MRIKFEQVKEIKQLELEIKQIELEKQKQGQLEKEAIRLENKRLLLECPQNAYDSYREHWNR